MPDKTQPPDSKQKTITSRGRWPAVAAIGLILLCVAIWSTPSYTFHPLCTYTVNAHVSADVEIAGQKLSATVVYQNSRSRAWLSTMNSAGCKQWYGTALTYKLANDSVLIIPSGICHKGQQELAKTGRLDILAVCTGNQAHQASAFIVDSASRPEKWYSVTNGADFRITKMTADSTWSEPTDDIASIAPNLLKSDFKYARQQWSRSPEKIISFQRRYNERRHKPNQSYEFEVNNERFRLE